MNKDTFDDLRLLTIVYKALAFITPVIILFAGIYSSSIFISNTSIPSTKYDIYTPVQQNNLGIVYYVVLITIAIVVAIGFYSKALNYSYKACVLENLNNIKEQLKGKGDE